jgi:hypothetical protein
MENKKLMKSAAVIDRILKILQGFAIAGVIVAAIFIPLTAILGEKIIADASRLNLGVLDLRLADAKAYLDMADIKTSIIVMLIGMILTSAAVWYCLRVLREILAPMKEGTPFAAGMAGKIRKLGWTVLIGGFVAEVGHRLSQLFEARAYQIERLLNMEAIASVDYNYSVSLWFVFAALILFFLSYIFRCGEALQKEADETL